MRIQRIKGTNDIFGEEIFYWRFVEETFRKVCESFGAEEMRTPIIEPTELFVRSVGEETDIVQKEMYTFVDRGGRSVTLRPEGTASLVRAFMENSLVNRGFPQRFYYVGPMFRYEKPQSGRLRQFHQIGYECIGSPSPRADFETILLLNTFLKEVGLTRHKVYINSIGCPSCRPNYRNALKEYYSFRYEQLCEDCKKRYERNVLRLLDCKVDVELARSAPKSVDFLCEECRRHYDELKEYLDSAGIPYVEDHTLVRGLDYYTRTVFEVRHEGLGAQNAIAGGGRYDGLFEDLDGPSIPALGFAGGIERIVLAMREEGILPPKVNPHEVYVVVLGKEAFKVGVELAKKLRERGVNTEVEIMERNISAQLKNANRLGARFSIIIGESEITRSVVLLRDMASGEQFEVGIDLAVDRVVDALKTKSS